MPDEQAEQEAGEEADVGPAAPDDAPGFAPPPVDVLDAVPALAGAAVDPTPSSR